MIGLVTALWWTLMALAHIGIYVWLRHTQWHALRERLPQGPAATLVALGAAFGLAALVSWLGYAGVLS